MEPLVDHDPDDERYEDGDYSTGFALDYEDIDDPKHPDHYETLVDIADLRDGVDD